MMPRKSEAIELPTIDWSRFDGIRAPTYTQTPDEIFDWIMAFLTGAELKVLLYITRRTFGFKKSADAISIPQLCAGIVTRDGRRLDWGTGLERSTVLKALRSLETKNLIVRQQQDDPTYGSQPTLYALNIKVESSYTSSVPLLQGGGIDSTRGYAPIHPGVDSTPSGGRKRSSPGASQIQPGESRRFNSQETVMQHTVSQDTDNVEASMSTLPEVPAAAEPKRRRSSPQRRADEDYQALVRPIDDIGREFGDEATTRASVTRAYNLMRESNLPIQDFVQLLFEAKALTRTYQASIVKTRRDSGKLPRKNLMPYFFATLNSLLQPDRQTPGLRRARLSQRTRSKVRRNGNSASRAARLELTGYLARQDVVPAPTQSMHASDMHPVWLQALEELRNVLTPENFDTWLADTYVISQEGTALLISVPKPFHKDWLDNKLRGRVESVLRRLGHGDLKVEFVVADG
jgi:hypothetical protein